MPPTDFEKLAEGVIKNATRVLGRGDVIYKPLSGGEYSIRGIFDDRAQQVDPETEEVVSSNVYTLGIALKDLPVPPKKGDTVLIANEEYQVISSQEDGAPGVSTALFMHKVKFRQWKK